jgi:hypothetical protein
MTVRVFNLMEAHQRIDEELRLEAKRRWPDVFKMMRLKKRKLRIKDRLVALASKRRRTAS